MKPCRHSPGTHKQTNQPSNQSNDNDLTTQTQKLNNNIQQHKQHDAGNPSLHLLSLSVLAPFLLAFLCIVNITSFVYLLAWFVCWFVCSTGSINTKAATCCKQTLAPELL
jgi:hypothetical protein